MCLFTPLKAEPDQVLALRAQFEHFEDFCGDGRKAALCLLTHNLGGHTLFSDAALEIDSRYGLNTDTT
jgi:hypothetical protein